MTTRNRKESASASTGSASQPAHEWKGEAVEKLPPTAELAEVAAAQAEGRGARSVEDPDAPRPDHPEAADEGNDDEENKEEKRRAAAEDHAAAPSKHGPHGKL